MQVIEEVKLEFGRKNVMSEEKYFLFLARLLRIKVKAALVLGASNTIALHRILDVAALLRSEVTQESLVCLGFIPAPVT
ncbi:jg15487 [Pararge aegeria aegeria]|uniref:Jg15487 protein n=1 Tax=Pararge aegeria aegeria TaxID=348720 RepID=A0A8S4R7Q8_9NEOP|nr:jg15487 [Pararge aegeria aegeria]